MVRAGDCEGRTLTSEGIQKGVARPLVHRLQAMGAMELICPELHMMAKRQRLLPRGGASGKEEL